MPSQPSRRALLTSSLAGAAAVGVAASRASDAATAAPAAAAKTTATKPLPVHNDFVLHAVRRLTFGATPALVAQVRKTGVTAWLDDQLNNLPDVTGTVEGAGIASLPLPTVVTGAVAAYAGSNTVQDLQVATLHRALYAQNQVYELMVEFWSNHLSINVNAENVGTYKLADDRDVIRQHALGKFSDLLKASAQSPAMLRYLNNDASLRYTPNENYARELMELHTVGVHGGYKQVDVHNAAIALTGMGVDTSTGNFFYTKQNHATGRVKVMGWSHPNNDVDKGKEVALSLVDYLAHHPATATRIASKLVRRLVSDHPPASLVASAAKVFRDNDTAIIPVIKHIVASKEFAGSIGLKSQRPFEWFTASIRALNLETAPDVSFYTGSLVFAMQTLSQAPFEWLQPDGYPDLAGPWSNTASMITRWNMAQYLVHGNLGGLQAPDLDALIGTPVPTTSAALVNRLSQKLIGFGPRAALGQAVLNGVGMSASHVLTKSAAKSVAPAMAALLLSSPEAQVR